MLQYILFNLGSNEYDEILATLRLYRLYMDARLIINVSVNPQPNTTIRSVGRSVYGDL